MVDQQIIDYVKTNVTAGYSLDDVKNKLLESGISQEDVDEAVKSAGVSGGEEVKQPSEEAAKAATEQPAEQAQEQPAQQPAEQKESTFKWWVIAVPLIVLVIMWVIFYFLLRSS